MSFVAVVVFFLARRSWQWWLVSSLASLFLVAMMIYFLVLGNDLYAEIVSELGIGYFWNLSMAIVLPPIIALALAAILKFRSGPIRSM